MLNRRIATNRILLRARDTMDRDYAGALDIDALAAAAFLSRAHFIRSFRDAFGETPHRYSSGGDSSGRWRCCATPTSR